MRTKLLHPGGAPSPEHEERRATLVAIGQLAGYLLPLPMPDGSLPDVALAAQRGLAVFIADAKHSEEASDRASGYRLRRYASWLARERHGAMPDVFAVAHPPGHSGWLPVLDKLAADAGILTGHGSVRWVGHGTFVSWLPCYGRLERAIRRPPG